MKVLGAVSTLLILALCHHALAAKAVFAHFMVDNTEHYEDSMWRVDIIQAYTAKIDAFALNIAAGKPYNAASIAAAFAAAETLNLGFKLFFSFDYAGNGAWAKADVLALLAQYSHHPNYFQHAPGRPLVSTFEGPGSAADWVEIKRTTGCFFIPDWSSLGAKAAIQLEAGVADGLFSWAAWPYNGNRMDSYTDASYQQFLGGKPYMMGVSPWFYTNLPQYKKNWMWPDELMLAWADRWTQVLTLQPQQPDYVEIISWNDFGESHYIGSYQTKAPYFADGQAAFDYVKGVPHNPLRWPLSLWADQYKKGVATVTEESLILQYLVNHVSDCSDGGTTINTASQLQVEGLPAGTLGYNYIGFMATVGSPVNVSITVGGHTQQGAWLVEPAGGVGVYYGYAYLAPGQDTGDVSANLIRDGAVIATVKGKPIGGCTDGYANFNPVVVGGFTSGTVSAQTVSVASQTCIKGTGAGDFAGICQVACGHGYCPPACVCQQMGILKTNLVYTGDKGYARSDPSYGGLCSFVYNLGYRFPKSCQTTDPGPLTSPSVSPFLPDACTAGTSGTTKYDVDDLCAWGCAYGYCPVHICSCTETGPLRPLSSYTSAKTDVDTMFAFYPDDGNADVHALCDFACNTVGLCVCEVQERYLCDYSTKYTSMEALQAAAAALPDDRMFCAEMWTLEFLSANMTANLGAYATVSHGYAELFGYYEDYIKSMIQPAITAFMTANGTKYFDCSVGPTAHAKFVNLNKTSTDADFTNKTSPDGVFTNTTSADTMFINMTSAVAPNFINTTSEGHFSNQTRVIRALGTCPTYQSVTSHGSKDWYWYLRDSTANEFWSILLANYGVERDWVAWGRVVPFSPCNVGQVCHYDTWNNFPVKAADSAITVDNPQDVWTGASGNLAALLSQIEATFLDLLFGSWDGSALDTVQVYALAVSMASQAILAMEQVKAIGKTQKEEEKNRLVGWIVTALLMIVPFVGEEAAAAAGLASAARAIAIAGGAANLGYDISAVVGEPGSAPFLIMGWLMGARGVTRLDRNAESFSKMAAARKGMTGEISKLGSIVDDTATRIQKITRSCTR